MDDQIQNITGRINAGANYSPLDLTTGAFYNSGTTTCCNGYDSRQITHFDASRVVRAGKTTHSKQIGVLYCIKAL